jgi:hypothetical protein
MPVVPCRTERPDPCRFRCARGEACEAAAALEGILVLNLVPEDEILALLALLDRLCAMLTRLGRMGDSSGGATLPGQRGRER